MPRKAHKYHYIYKTTCNVTEKFYIGMHSTSNLEDGYMGSGKRLKRSLNKYGVENHTKVILEFLLDRKSLAEREREIVNQEMIDESLCMNLKLGGEGGTYSIEHQILRGKLGGLSYAKRLKEDSDFRDRITIQRRELYKKQQESSKPFRPEHSGFLGKSHTEESKRLIGVTNSIKQKGENNSQFGKCWITNEIESKTIYKGDTIPEGWRLGRKIKIIDELKN